MCQLVRAGKASCLCVSVRRETGLQAMVWRPPHVTALSRKHRSCCAHLFILGATALAAIWVMNGVSFVGVPRCKRGLAKHRHSCPVGSTESREQH